MDEKLGVRGGQGRSADDLVETALGFLYVVLIATSVCGLGYLALAALGVA